MNHYDLVVIGGGFSSIRTRQLQFDLSEYEGIRDISDDADAGRRELRLTVRDGAKELGFTTCA